MEDLLKVFKLVKSDFCNLTDYKMHGNTMEISTSLSTLNQSHVSVFFSKQGDEYVVSDGGWLYEDEYEIGTLEIENNPLLSYLVNYHSIKNVYSKNNALFFYKKAVDVNHVSACVYDVATFVAAYVNAVLLDSVLHNDKPRRKSFYSRINSHLRSRYSSDEFKANEYVNVDNQHQVRFSAVIDPYAVNANRTVLMYVSGSVRDDFNDSLARATSNFDIINKFAVVKAYYTKIAVIDADAPGYDPIASELYQRNLSDAIDRKPLLISSATELAILDNFLPASGQNKT